MTKLQHSFLSSHKYLLNHHFKILRLLIYENISLLWNFMCKINFKKKLAVRTLEFPFYKMLGLFAKMENTFLLLLMLMGNHTNC